MASEVSSKIAKFAHDYRSRLLQEQGKSAAKMTKYDVALFMKKEGALSESEFNSWVKEKEGQDALQLTTQQQDALRRGTIFNFVQGMQSYLDSDEVSDMTLGNVLGFEKTTNEKTGVTTIKSKAVSRKKYNLAEELKKESFMNYIKSLPTPEATYTELIRSIEFNKLDNKGKMEMMLKISGEKFNEAKAKGDKEAMKEYLLEGLGMAFQIACKKVDDATGITATKDFLYNRTIYHRLVELVDKLVDDGDNATLSDYEKNWEGIKGFAQAMADFAGAQGVAFVGGLEMLSAGAAGLSAMTGVKAFSIGFNVLTKGLFMYQGGTMMAEGAKGFNNAQTKEEASQYGGEFGMGAFMFFGSAKSLINDIQAYRASITAPEGQGGLPELSEGHQAVLNKNMPATADKAQVTTDLAFLQQNGVEIVDFRPGHGVNHTESSFIVKFNGKNYDITNDLIGPSSFETAISQLAQHIKGETPKVWTEVNGVMKQSASETIAAAEAKIATTETPAIDTNVKTPQIDAKTQQAVQDGLIRMEYIEDVENALTTPGVQNLVRNTMLRAKTQAELQYFADKFKNSESTSNRYNALQAEAYKDQLPVKPSSDTLGTATGQKLLPEGEKAVSAGKETPFTVPEGTTVEQARAKISELQQNLKSYGAGTDRYDQIHMDRIQEQIRAYREVAPLDRTNLEEVMQASPDEVFQPVKADNIKGQGISFKPYVPEDPEALAKVTYRAVPLYTNARTVAEMIRIAARDGVKIEMVQDAEGNYYPGVKAIWSEGGYFKLDRDSYVVKYGEIAADDPYIDQAWAQQNKYINAEGKEVVMDCAIVAADKATAADIMPHSYVKANGANLSASDKTNWNGFEAHKDPQGVVNAVAYESPKELQTLEGKITTDVTMGDVEGNVYNKFKDLKKQIIKDKLVANPEDPNSQTFIDLIKAGKDEEAIALLRQATKATSGENPTGTQLSFAEADMRTKQIPYEKGTNAQGNTEIRVKTSSVGIAGMEKSTFDIYEYDAKGSLVSTKKDVSSKGLAKLNDVETVDNSTGGQANMSILPGIMSRSSKVSSNDFLTTTNRILHPKNYTRAQELQSKGMEVTFDPNTHTARISVDVNTEADIFILNQLKGKEIKQSAGEINFTRRELDTYKETEIYKFKGMINGKAVFELNATNMTVALQRALDTANGKRFVVDRNNNQEPMQTFEQTLNKLVSNEREYFKNNVKAKVPEGLREEAGELADQMLPGGTYDYDGATVSALQRVKIDLLAKHGIKIDAQIIKNDGPTYTSEKTYIHQEGNKTRTENVTEIKHSHSIDESLDNVLDAKLKEVEYDFVKEKAANGDKKATKRLEELDAAKAVKAKAEAETAKAEVMMRSHHNNAEASGVKESKSEIYGYERSIGRDNSEYHQATKTVTTYNDGTVKTEFKENATITQFTDGGFEIRNGNVNAFYDPKGKMIITDSSSDNLNLSIEIDSKTLQKAGIKPETFISASYDKKHPVNYEQFYAIRDMFNGISKATLNKAKADLENIATRLENDPVFKDQVELKQTVAQMLEELPKTEDMVDRKCHPSYYHNAIKKLQEQMAEIAKFTSKLERDNIAGSGSQEILEAIKVPMEDMRAVDRQILSDLASINKTLNLESKIFHDRPGFKKDYEALKNDVIQELNSNGNTEAIEGVVRARITKMRIDLQKMIDALGDK